MIDAPHWTSAGELAAAIGRGELSSLELLEHFVARIRALDGPVNAVVAWDLERARATARQADAAVAAGGPLGPLHGVPMTIKDSFPTAGCVTTSGSTDLADFVPAEDAWPVARLRAAGAIPFAKTNLPVFADDIQSFNDVYGTTNNPHDLTRTPGGSSGGSSAALAMGFTPLELGSDIGGSIRVPAHYSGVMGHKPSYGLVPGHGQIPGMPGTLTQADLAVVGPLARSADDLELALDVLAGPDRWTAPAWRLDLPPRAADDLAGYRIAAWIDDEFAPVDRDTRAALGAMVDALETAGASVDTGARPGFTLDKAFTVYGELLFAALSGAVPKDRLDEFARATGDDPMSWIMRSSAARHRDWLSNNERRLQLRERWAEFFTRFDAVLLPVHQRPALPHDHSMPQFSRTVEIDGVERPYLDLWKWIAPAGVGMLPATVAPVGASTDGLPIGVQVVGPYLHDRTTIHLAGLINDQMAARHGWPAACPRPPIA
ncbi:MAG TPA: amidase [Ilumatobacteraceae bacterium]|nr:amidase [Ilumatobacteraceae bacterium]